METLIKLLTTKIVPKRLRGPWWLSGERIKAKTRCAPLVSSCSNSFKDWGDKLKNATSEPETRALMTRRMPTTTRLTQWSIKDVADISGSIRAGSIRTAGRRRQLVGSPRRPAVWPVSPEPKVAQQVWRFVAQVGRPLSVGRVPGCHGPEQDREVA